MHHHDTKTKNKGGKSVHKSAQIYYFAEIKMLNYQVLRLEKTKPHNLVLHTSTPIQEIIIEDQVQY